MKTEYNNSGERRGNSSRTSLNIWAGILGIIAIAILAIIIFCHIAVWLMWIGAFTVLILIVWAAIYLNKAKNWVEDKLDDD